MATATSPKNTAMRPEKLTDIDEIQTAFESLCTDEVSVLLFFNESVK